MIATTNQSPLPFGGAGGGSIIIIGAGPGGYRAAELAAKAGSKVTIFEESEVGGTCLNVGCIPTKTYVHSATFAEARERMPQVVQQLRSGVEQILSHPNITLIREKFSFDKVSLPHREGLGGKSFIIATGSETKWLPIPGIADDPRVVDSTGLLQLEQLPRKLAIIGAGVIGMEFASIFNRFGTEVTVIEYLKECLPALDSDIAKRLRKVLEKQGITFRMKTAVQSLTDIDADVILMATGRRPRTEGLNLEALGITLNRDGSIPVDNHFRVVSPHLPEGAALYAIGDVNGRQMLAHAAEWQARVVVNRILGAIDSPPVGGVGGGSPIPAAIFTTPEAACVGPTEDQMKAQSIAYECRKSFWRANGKALAMGETEGVLKLFSEPDAGRILGCHAFGVHSADIVQEVSVLMCRDTTIAQLRDMVHIHPTLSEILLTAAEQ